MATYEVINYAWKQETTDATATTVLTINLPTNGTTISYWGQNVARRSDNAAYGGKVDGIARRDSDIVEESQGFAPRVIGAGAGNFNTNGEGTNLIVRVTGQIGQTYQHSGYLTGIMRVE